MELMVVVFFFQAEDGIRDHCVTGVQTCALPILRSPARALCPLERFVIFVAWSSANLRRSSSAYASRSEERRVGKECRSRWVPRNDREKQERGPERAVE